MLTRMSERPRLSDETAERLDSIQREYGYGSREAAIRHLLREVGDV